MSAHARQMRCSCPPLMWLSDSEPITVSKPPGRGSTKDVTSARSAAFLTSSSVASGRPILMLAATEPFKMAVSCITTPSCLRTSFGVTLASALPSKPTNPELPFCSRVMRDISVDLPAPLPPTTQVYSPTGTTANMPLSTRFLLPG